MGCNRSPHLQDQEADLFLKKPVLRCNDLFVDGPSQGHHFLDFSRQLVHTDFFGSFGPKQVIFGMIGIVPEPVNEQFFEFSPHLAPIGSIQGLGTRR